MRKILILGLGNILLRDEGLGVRAVELFREWYELPPGVEVCDGGSRGLGLLPRLEGVTYLMLVDAAEMNRKPGTIERLEVRESDQRWDWKLSAHQIDISGLLSAAALMGYRFKKVVALVMQLKSMAPGLQMSPAVAAALPRMVRAIAKELARWGLSLRRVRHQEILQAAPERRMTYVFGCAGQGAQGRGDAGRHSLR